MFMLFRPKAIIPVWVVAFGLVTLFVEPMTWATGALLLFAAVVPPAILLILSRERSLTVAEVLHHAETSQSK
jgi:hypothetical protein